jgi:hypothetical protein
LAAAFAGFRLDFLVAMVTPFTRASLDLVPGAYSTPGHSTLIVQSVWPVYFLRILLCGLRLPILPLSLPAPGSMAALMRVGWPEFMAWSTARLSSHQFLVARVLDEDGGRNIRTAGRIDVGAAIDAVVVEDDDTDRQLVAADRLHFHAGEAEGAVAFDREHGLAGLDRGPDRIAHADTHDAPGADVQALARLVHVDDAAREIERVGAFVDQNGVRPLLDDGTQCAERAVEVHRRRILHQSRRHLGDVLFLLCIDGADPVGRRGRPLAVDALEQSRHAGADIADQRSHDLDIAVHLLGLDVDLDELLRSGLAPGLALAVR